MVLAPLCTGLMFPPPAFFSTISPFATRKLQVVQPLLRHAQYQAVKYAEVRAATNSVGVSVRFATTAAPPTGWVSFARFAEQVRPSPPLRCSDTRWFCDIVLARSLPLSLSPRFLFITRSKGGAPEGWRGVHRPGKAAGTRARVPTGAFRQSHPLQMRHAASGVCICCSAHILSKAAAGNSVRAPASQRGAAGAHLLPATYRHSAGLCALHAAVLPLLRTHGAPSCSHLSSPLAAARRWNCGSSPTADGSMKARGAWGGMGLLTGQAGGAASRTTGFHAWFRRTGLAAVAGAVAALFRRFRHTGCAVPSPARSEATADGPFRPLTNITLRDGLGSNPQSQQPQPPSHMRRRC
jgi:hypothetical protein